MVEQKQQYAIQVLAEDGGWHQWYVSDERADAEGVWRRLLGSEPKGRARLVEIEILKESRDEAARE